MQRVFISSANTVTLSCPHCRSMRTVSIDQFKGLDKAVKVKVRCPCGQSYPVMLERRQQFRKEVALSGTYVQIVNGRPMGRGSMVVKDISRSGLKLRVPMTQHLKCGHILEVEFRLDDAKKSLIQKEVVIRKIDASDLGTQFVSITPGDPSDKALGFYLMG